MANLLARLGPPLLVTVIVAALAVVTFDFWAGITLLAAALTGLMLRRIVRRAPTGHAAAPVPADEA